MQYTLGSSPSGLWYKTRSVLLHVYMNVVQSTTLLSGHCKDQSMPYVFYVFALLSMHVTFATIYFIALRI